MRADNGQLSLDIANPLVEQRAFVPKEFITTPFFLAGEQTHGRRVPFREGSWTFGVSNPLRTSRPSSTINFSHIRLWLALLSLRFPGSEHLECSLRRIIAAYGESTGSFMRAKVREMLDDLRDFWVLVERPGENDLRFSLIHGIGTEQEPASALQGGRPAREFVSDLRVHPYVLGVLNELNRCLHVRVDVLNQLRTDTARAIYLYIPSCAVNYASQDGAWTIKARKLLDQVGDPSFAEMAPSTLRRLIERSILSLDGARLLTGTLRCSVDFSCKVNPLVSFWAEGRNTKTLAESVIGRNGALVQVLRTKAGWSTADIRVRLQRIPELDSFAIETLTRCGIDVVKDKLFFQVASRLIGSQQFLMMARELHAQHREGQFRGETPAVFAWRLMEKAKTLPKPSK